MSNIELSCPVTLDDWTKENFEEAILIIVGTTVYPILPSKDLKGNLLLTATGILNQLKECPNTRIKGAYKTLELSALSQDLKELKELKTCLFNEKNEEPISTSKLAKLLVDKNKQFYKLLTDKTFSQAQTVPHPQMLQLPPLLARVLTAEQYGQLARNTQKVIIDTAVGIHNLMTEGGLSFNNIQRLSAHSLNELVHSPHGVNGVRQLEGFTFDKLAGLDADQLLELVRHPDGVNAVREYGASFEQLKGLHIDSLRVLVRHPDGVNAVREYGASFEQLKDLHISSLIELVRHPDGVNAVREYGASFEQLKGLHIDSLRVLVRHPDGVNAVREYGASFEQLKGLHIDSLRELVRNPQSQESEQIRNHQLQPTSSHGPVMFANVQARDAEGNNSQKGSGCTIS